MRAFPEVLNAGLLDENDTAFIAFDLELLGKRLDALRSAFPMDFHHAIAIKTNPQLVVLSFILDAGFGLEAASWEELKLAVKAGATGAQLVFDSPVKTHKEILWCAEHLPGLMLNVNSLAELNRIPTDHGFRLGIRVNPLVQASGDAMYDVSTKQSKFGVAMDARASIVDAAVKWGVQGLHMHVGSGAVDIKGHIQAAHNLVSLADEVNQALKEKGASPLTFLNVGGGLSASMEEDGMAKYGRALAEVASGSDQSWSTEFGQWVHQSVGSLFSRVEYVHPPTGSNLGMAFLHFGADLMVRQVYHKRQTLQVTAWSPEGTEKSGAKKSYRLVGPLCFAGDVLADEVGLTDLVEGDWIGVHRMGANTLGLWSRHCSRDVPKVLVKRPSGRWSCVQDRTPIIF